MRGRLRRRRITLNSFRLVRNRKDRTIKWESPDRVFPRRGRFPMLGDLPWDQLEERNQVKLLAEKQRTNAKQTPPKKEETETPGEEKHLRKALSTHTQSGQSSPKVERMSCRVQQHPRYLAYLKLLVIPDNTPLLGSASKMSDPSLRFLICWRWYPRKPVLPCRFCNCCFHLPHRCTRSLRSFFSGHSTGGQIKFFPHAVLL